MLKDFTDIKSDGWVGKVPLKWQPYIHLARLDRPVGIWLLLLPGLWSIMLAGGFAQWWLMVLFAIGAATMRSAGCVINDIWDRDLDAKVERTKGRPLASGALSLKQAVVFFLILLLIGFCVLMQLNILTILLGLLSVPLVVAYPLMKRWTYWPQAFLGLTINFGALLGWSAVNAVPGIAALFLYLGGIFWTLGYDTIYAHQDKEDDALIGVRSTALIFGDKSKQWVGAFYGVSALMFCAAVYQAGAHIGIVVLTLLIVGGHFGWQLKTWDSERQESCLRIFKSNRNFGLIVLLCMIAAHYL